MEFLLLILLIIIIIIAIYIYIRGRKKGNLSAKERQEPVINIKISSNEEADIIKILCSIFFSPVIKISLIHFSLEPQEKDSYKKFHASNEYSYLANFVKKYGENYSAADLLKLKELLNTKGCYFSEEELRDLMVLEKKKQAYDDFKKTILTCNPSSVYDYIKVFVESFGKELASINEYGETYRNGELFFNTTHNDWLIYIPTPGGRGIYSDKWLIPMINSALKLHFLKKLLSENKTALKDWFSEDVINNEELIKMIISEIRKYELQKFEKSLQKEKMCSIEDIDSMDGYGFEGFLTILFGKMGYTVEQTKLSGDQGADLIINKSGETAVVQAKRSNNKVGNNAIQEIVASINYYKAQKGIVVTNNEFTPSAIELAKSNNITLVDRFELIKLIKEYL